VNIIIIALNELKIMFKSKGTLILLLIMPIMMIALMGYALKPYLNPSHEIIKFDVLYVNQDEGKIGQSFDTFIKDQGAKYFNLIISSTEDIESEMLKNNYDEAIFIPKDFTLKVNNSESISIIHISSGKNLMRDNMVKVLVNQFTTSVNESIAIQKVAESYHFQIDINQIHSDIVLDLGSQFIEIDELEKTNSLGITSFQYFAASMLVFFLLCSSMGLGMEIVNDRTNKIYARINTYPVTKNQYLLGKTLGNAFISIVQAISIIVISALLFQVNWGREYIGLTIVVLVIIFISSGVSVIFSSLFNSSKTLSTVLIMIYWMLTFISGAFTPVPAFEKIGKFIFNMWAFESITSYMTGQSLVTSIYNIMMLLGLGLVLWLIGMYMYRRGTNE